MVAKHQQRASQALERASFTLALQGGPDRSGEISFDRLAEVAEHVQMEILRLARAHVDRDRAGRTPDDLVALTRLSLAGIDPGSTELTVRGPARESALNITDMPEDLGSMAIRDFLDAFAAVQERRPLPQAFEGPASESLDELLRALDDVPIVVVKDVQGLADAPNRVEFRPRETRELFLSQRSQAQPTERGLVLVGTLFAVNLHTGQYQIEDDAGNKSRCDVETMSAEVMGPLLGKRVRARGIGRWDRKGRFQRLDVENIELAEHEQLALEGWPRSVSTEEVLATAAGPEALESYALEDLQPGEAEVLREILRSL